MCNPRHAQNDQMVFNVKEQELHGQQFALSVTIDRQASQMPALFVLSAHSRLREEQKMKVNDFNVQREGYEHKLDLQMSLRVLLDLMDRYAIQHLVQEVQLAVRLDFIVLVEPESAKCITICVQQGFIAIVEQEMLVNTIRSALKSIIVHQRLRHFQISQAPEQIMLPRLSDLIKNII